MLSYTEAFNKIYPEFTKIPLFVYEDGRAKGNNRRVLKDRRGEDYYTNKYPINDKQISYAGHIRDLINDIRNQIHLSDTETIKVNAKRLLELEKKFKNARKAVVGFFDKKSYLIKGERYFSIPSEDEQIPECSNDFHLEKFIREIGNYFILEITEEQLKTTFIYSKWGTISNPVAAIDSIFNHLTVNDAYIKDLIGIHTVLVPDINQPDKSKGFKSNLTDNQIENLYDELKGNYINENTSKQYFKTIFSINPLPDGFEPVIWIKKNTRNKKSLNKASLIDLLELAGIHRFSNGFREKTNRLFAKEKDTSINLEHSNISNNKSKEHSEFYDNLKAIFSRILAK